MTLMPVSKTSDLVERRASDGGARCTERHWTIPLRDLFVANYVEHPRENRFADRCFQWSARVLHRHSASETLRGRQRDPTHVMRILLRRHCRAPRRPRRGMGSSQFLVRAYSAFCKSRIGPTSAASDATHFLRRDVSPTKWPSER
jgi:hypothetical protein